ncbi:MAG: hypothetical protein ACJ8EL_11265 [Rhizomicrobium sp.]|jgi:hypothetical protein
MFFQAIEFAQDSAWSLGACFSLRFTKTGNLELWDVPAQRLLWESGTEGDILAMQLDGNLVVYGKNREPLWASDTAGNLNAVLAASDEGRLTILSADRGTTLWQAPPTSELQPITADTKESDEGRAQEDERLTPTGEATAAASRPGIATAR